MSFPRYPAYKHSRIEQLGDVPEHWEVVPVKRCLKSITQGWSPQCENYPADAGQWGVLKVGCVNGRSFDPSENKALPSTLEPLPELSIRRGDVLVSRANTRELVGSVAVAERDYERLMLCDKLYRLRVDEQRCDAAFLASSLSTPAARGVIEATASGASSSMLNIGQAAITGMFIAVPPLREQQALVAFVQNEAAKIDALAEEQRRLIELLKEKRQAVISQAVTKGLNPNAPMKDSGVKWLGEVPAHWGMTKLKHLVAESVAGPYGASLTKDMYTSSGYRVYGQQQVIPDDFTVGDYYISEAKFDEMRRYSVYKGDVLVSVMGTIGKVAVVPGNVEPGIINPRLVRYRCSESIRPRYLQRVLLSQKHQEHLLFEAKGTTMDGLNMSTLGNVPVPVPPLAEQAQIVEWLSSIQDETDALVVEAEKAASLLLERRAALISAAVTGKIDVRGLAPQPEAVAA
jgi:type I restriction enzyme S subunit